MQLDVGTKVIHSNASSKGIYLFILFMNVWTSSILSAVDTNGDPAFFFEKPTKEPKELAIFNTEGLTRDGTWNLWS